MGFRQLLDVVRSTHQRVVIKLLIPDLHHLKDDLSVFCPSCYAELSGYAAKPLTTPASPQSLRLPDDKPRRGGHYQSPQKLRAPDGHNPLERR